MNVLFLTADQWRGECLSAQAYLAHVLERIADHPINRVDELLSWKMVSELKSRHGEAQEAA